MPSFHSYEDCVIAGQLPFGENVTIYRRKGIFRKAAGNAISQEHPVAIILGGQNASGKSTLGEQFLFKYEHQGCGIVRIEGDALRDYHPKFDEYNRVDDKLMVAYTAKDSGIWTRRLIEDARRSRMNMLIETTLRSPEVVTETVLQLAEGGYDVQVKVIVVSYDKSLLGSYERYETLKAVRGAGRFVHDHTLRAVYGRMPETLQALKEQEKCSCIHLYTREKPLFEGDYRQADVVSIIKQERCRVYTQDEVRFLQEGWKRVGEHMLVRRAAKNEFLEISRRMRERIDFMVKEGNATKNVSTMTSIHQSFNSFFMK
jgi:UDP-N-acetylglucosamine kinase